MINAAAIGGRMLETRKDHDLPQSKVAALLHISDRGYKNYETGKREIPLSVALAFCERFGISFSWLVTGTDCLHPDDVGVAVGQLVSEIFAESSKRGLQLTPTQAGKIGAYIFKTCHTNRTSPNQEVAAVFELMGES
ncbi:helix-turn-helix transcriptional regulator [Qipengyuania sp. XHP0207]|uniref:helix-turn-helix domain-containing protein n=1 Tax=Qipengyuania sp. XHP0207 TaxID=3038078 RepID=UPI00241F5C4A|nr:helix-turn-helix transcriptional regulator [Qipengyuania sp. XHP0207]MDG5749154.1 helix-turn-helix transcriptional regulator [Qipengyuania sp. XHP0207]